MRKQIALISEHASPAAIPGSVDCGGQNVYVAQVARQLARRGHQVTVFTRRDSPELRVSQPWCDHIELVHVPAGPARFIAKESLLDYMEEFADFMTLYLRRRGPCDLMHANFWMSGLVACRVQQRLGIPLVVTFHALGKVRRMHQGQADAFPEQRSEIERQVMIAADRIIAECPQDRDDQVQLYDADPDKIRLVPCGFDPAEFWPIKRDVARGKLRLARDEFVVLQLGRIVPRKGIDNVIRAAALLQRRGMPVRLLIVGGDDGSCGAATAAELNRLQLIAQQEGVSDRVTFAGQRGRDVLKYYYSAADVFVTTPWYEPFGITPLESMACGTPVIGAAVGGLKYTIVDGQTGFLVPPREPDALAARLGELYEQPALRRQLSRRAAEWVNARFTWQRVVAMIDNVYDDVLRAQPLAPVLGDRRGLSLVSTSQLKG